ncbi:MAG: nucleoside-diphosphate sugar epimerase/dehydratase, partial [Rhodothermales bacterium]
MSYASSLSQRYIRSNRLEKDDKRWIVKFAIDLVLWVVTIPLAFWMRLEDQWLTLPGALAVLVLVSIPIMAILIYRAALYRRSWQKLGFRDLLALAAAVTTLTVILEVITIVGLTPVPRSVPLIAGMLAMLMLGSARVAARVIFEESGRRSASLKGRTRKVLIAGAGDAGTMIAREMLRNPSANLVPIGFLDDAPYKRNERYVGVDVLGPLASLPEVIFEHEVDEVLIAMPSASGDVVRRVVELARVARVKHRTIPGVYELLSGNVSISQIREVDYEDLLRREPVRLETDRIAYYLDERVVLVTGAGGSIGSEIVRQIARFEPALIIILERSEAHLYEIDIEMRDRYPEIDRVAVVGDVCDPETVREVFESYGAAVVFHAAAYKHVPLMESHPCQAVLNNVGGTQNLVTHALAYGTERFVNISTDKAVNPTSAMGATKRVAEMMVYEASKRTADGQAFVSVRFGNVLGSSGSVAPLFKKQIQQGGPVTVTHPEMTRYFMTIPEASQLVLQAGSLAENGNVYALDMGEPVRIVDLANYLILISVLKLGLDID